MADEENSNTEAEHDFTEEELAMLDENERAAITGEEPGEDSDDDEPGHDDGADNGGSDDGEGEDGGDDADTGDDDTGDDDKGEGGDTDEHQEQAPPEEAPETDPVTELQTKVEGIDDQINSLGQQFEDGELDFRQYHQKLNELNNEKLSVRDEITSHRTREEVRQQENARQFENAKTRFFSTEGNDIFAKNEIAATALATAFRRVNADPANANMDYFARMQAAKDAVVESGFFGAPKDTETPKNKADKTRDGKKRDIPQTLGDMPAAESNEGGQFKHLDDLEGLELEDALARMSPEDEKRYLNS